MKFIRAATAIVTLAFGFSAVASGETAFVGHRKTEGGVQVREGHVIAPEDEAEIAQNQACADAIDQCQQTHGRECVVVQQADTFAAYGYANEGAVYSCWADLAENAAKRKGQYRRRFRDLFSAEAD